MMQIHDVKQRSPEWFALRCGRITASHFDTMGNGTTKGRETMCMKIAAEIITGQSPPGYQSKAMQNGTEMEDEAIAAYSVEKWATVTPIGFVSINEYIGGSPDGFIDEDGGVEVKCPEPHTHLGYILKGETAWRQYKWQVQGNLWLSGRSWWDWVSYCPQFGEQSLIIQRIKPDAEMYAKLEAGSKKCIHRIRQIVEAAKGVVK